MKNLNNRGLIILVVLASMLLASNAKADTDPLDKIYLDVHLTSLHQSPDGFEEGGVHYDTNQNNFGLGLTIPTHYTNGMLNTTMSVRIGFYNNSYNQTSIYAGLNPHTEFTNGFGYGVLLGIVNGYDASPDGDDVLPIIAPSLHYIYNDFKIESALLASKYNPSITLTISYSF